MTRVQDGEAFRLSCLLDPYLKPAGPAVEGVTAEIQGYAEQAIGDVHAVQGNGKADQVTLGRIVEKSELEVETPVGWAAAGGQKALVGERCPCGSLDNRPTAQIGRPSSHPSGAFRICIGDAA